MHYYAEKFHQSLPSRVRPETRYSWSGTTVISILSKPEYMGHTVNFRSSKKSYKTNEKVHHDPKDWLIFENTHEAIVPADVWHLAQREKGSRRRIDNIGFANPLTGYVFCADCGRKMYNSRALRDVNDASKGLQGNSYNCSTYSLTRNYETKNAPPISLQPMHCAPCCWIPSGRFVDTPLQIRKHLLNRFVPKQKFSMKPV